MADDTYVSIDEFLNSRKDYVKSGDVLMKCTVQSGVVEQEMKRMRPASSWNPEKRTIRFVMSSELEDRDKDIILQAGLNIERFLENPIAFYNHMSRDFPVGGWNDLEKILTGRPKRTEGTLQVLPEGVEPNADRLARHFGAGSIKTASIGFIPVRVKRREKPTDAKDEYGFNGYFIEEAEMVECSAVNVPSNPAALAKMAADGDVRAREEIEMVLDTWARHPETGLIIPRSEFEAAYKSATGDKGVVVTIKNDSGAFIETLKKADGSIDVIIDAIDARLNERTKRTRDAIRKAVDGPRPEEAPHDPAQPESPPAAAPEAPATPPAPPADPDPAPQPPLTEEQKDSLLMRIFKWFGSKSDEDIERELAAQKRREAEEAIAAAARKDALEKRLQTLETRLKDKGLVD